MLRAALIVCVSILPCAVSAAVIYGLAFSPYMDGQEPPGFVDPNQSRDRLEIIHSRTRWVRTYGSASGLQYISEIARGYGLKVAQCVFLNGDADDDKLEKDNLIAAAVAGNVDVAIVGSEAFVDGRVTEQELISHLQDVRRRLDRAGLQHIPVTTAEPYGDWANNERDGLFSRDVDGNLKHAEMLRNVDLVFVHLHPFTRALRSTAPWRSSRRCMQRSRPPWRRSFPADCRS